MFKRISIITILSAALLQACYYDVESELYGVVDPCASNDFTYSGRILPLIEANCLSCHSQSQGSGGIVLEGYTNIRNSAVAGNLLCSIEQTGDCVAMPQGSKLPDCQIDAVRAWIDAGAPEN